jgi:predicted regulator of amino acid metabolism with ACT domain
MEVKEIVKERDVVDYDFLFTSGAKLSITLDPAAGDVFEELPDRFVLRTVAKPSFTEPGETTTAEDIEVFKTSLASKITCKRKQEMPTEEDIHNTKKLIHAMARMVQ